MSDSPVSTSGAQAAASPAATAAPSAPARTTTSKAEAVQAARSSAERVEVPGSRTRAESRAKALAGIDRHQIARDMAASRAAKVDGGEGEGDAAPVKVVARDAAGRFTKADGTLSLPNEAAPVATEGEGEGNPQAQAKATEIPPEVTQKIASLEESYKQADAKLREGAALAQERIDDITVERDHWQGMFKRLVAGLAQRKISVDPLELQLAEQRLQLAKHDRRSRAVQTQQQEQQVQQLAGGIRTRIAGLISSHPELDPNNAANPYAAEAKAFWQARLIVPEGATPPSLDGLENDAAAIAALYRARAAKALADKQAAARPPKPEPRERPAAMIPHGQAGAEGTAGGVPGQRGAHVSNKAIAQHMEKLRAIRGGKR